LVEVPDARRAEGRVYKLPHVLLAILAIVTGSNSYLIAVGTPITERPPHRTVRAAFPHTAPTSDD
jgi:hypothetical protein